MLTLGNIDLLTPSADSNFTDLEAEVRDKIPQCDAFPWLARAFPGRRASAIAVPTGFRPARPVLLNRYFYPCWGASRFGYGHFLASSRQADDIRVASFGVTGLGPPLPLNLAMACDGQQSGDVLNTAVFVLRLTPLVRVDPAFVPETDSQQNPTSANGQKYVNGLYLVTVVDERYWWWWASYPQTYPAAGPDTWAAVLTRCANALEIKIDGKGIDPAYLQADRSIAALGGEPVPRVLDAALANVGQRFVRTIDGFYAAQGGLDAQAAHRQNQRAWSVRGGGELYQGAL